MLSTTPTISRPLGVGILGVLLILGGLLNLVAGIGLTRPADPATLGIPSLALIFGLVYLGTGIGFLQRVTLAWYLGIVISLLDIIRRFILLAYQDLFSLVGVFVDLLIIFYLLEPRVQQYFGVGNQAQTG